MAMASLVALTYLAGATAGESQTLPPGYVHDPYYPNYGGYKSWIAVVTEDTPHIIFVNYPENDCKGMAWNLTNVMNGCFSAKLGFVDYYWKAVANDKNQVFFNNYLDSGCDGINLYQRCYPTMQCMNCPADDPVDCKAHHCD